MSNWYMNQRIRWKVYKSQKELEKFCRLNSLNSTKTFSINRWKNSDTLCVLGSGDSINGLSEKNWEFIRSNDSVGFNNWLLHQHVPTFYFFESGKQSPIYENIYKTYFRNIAARSESYADVPMIISYLPKRYYDLDILRSSGWLERTFFHNSVSLPGNSLAELKHSVDTSLKAGYFNKIYPCVYRRGTLARIMHFAIASGYKNIILYGIDLNGSDYFFQDKHFIPNNPNIMIPDISVYSQHNTIHSTVDPSRPGVTMIDVINVLNEIVLKPLNINLYIGTKSSALYPLLSFADKSTNSDTST